MLKYTLTVNDQTSEGFKLDFKADSEKELKVAYDITEKLIEKISKIEVSINNHEE